MATEKESGLNIDGIVECPTCCGDGVIPTPDPRWHPAPPMRTEEPEKLPAPSSRSHADEKSKLATCGRNWCSDMDIRVAESLTLPQLIEKWRQKSEQSNVASMKNQDDEQAGILAGEADTLSTCADELAATLTELEQQIEQFAIKHHKSVDGEYGCAGSTCPGVIRLVEFGRKCTGLAPHTDRDGEE